MFSGNSFCESCNTQSDTEEFASVNSNKLSIDNRVNASLISNIFVTKGRIILIFDTGYSRCFTSYQGDFVELVEKYGAEKFKGVVKGLKIKVKYIVQYNLEDYNGQFINLSMKA